MSVINKILETIKSRGKDYGDPIENFQKVAHLSSVLLEKELTSKDILMIMVIVKLSRNVNKFKSDNIIDAIAYLDFLHSVNEREIDENV